MNSMHFLNSNKGEKGQIFQSCTSVRDDPQFSVQLANKPPTQSEALNSHGRNRSLSVEGLLLQGSLLAPGMEIPPKQAKQVIIVFNAKYDTITYLHYYSNIHVLNCHSPNGDFQGHCENMNLSEQHLCMSSQDNNIIFCFLETLAGSIIF